MELSTVADFVLQADDAELLRTEFAFIIMLSIAALVAIIIRRLRVPYTVALVVVGLSLSLFPSFVDLEAIGDELILAILVPPLLFEATLHIPWQRLRADLGLVLLLAVFGTLVGTLMVGGIVSQVLPEVTLLGAFAFGALISATDPVAVIAFFRSLGVSKRLAILVEGESLLNDGVAIVLFGLATGAAAAGTSSLSLGSAVFEFLRVALGGVGVGLVLGYVVARIFLENVDDHLVETATTVALAFGAYVIGEQLHVSGILAVVAAGLMVGNLGLENTSPTTRLTLENFWEFMAFVANSLVFLLIGLEIEIRLFLPFLVPIIVAVVAVLVSRAIIVYSFSGLYSWLSPRRSIPHPFRHVMYWGGLRGAISLALALTLSPAVFGVQAVREVQVMTFGVVLFTLLVQGTTIDNLIRRLGLADRAQQNLEQQRQQAMIYAKTAGMQELDRLRQEGILFPDIWEAFRAVYEEETDQQRVALREHLTTFPELEQEMYLQARADVLRAERSAISDAARRGLIAEQVLHELVREANNRIAALEIVTTRRGLGGSVEVRPGKREREQVANGSDGGSASEDGRGKPGQ